MCATVLNARKACTLYQCWEFAMLCVVSYPFHDPRCRYTTPAPMKRESLPRLRLELLSASGGFSRTLTGITRLLQNTSSRIYTYILIVLRRKTKTKRQKARLRKSNPEATSSRPCCFPRPMSHLKSMMLYAKHDTDERTHRRADHRTIQSRTWKIDAATASLTLTVRSIRRLKTNNNLKVCYGCVMILTFRSIRRLDRAYPPHLRWPPGGRRIPLPTRSRDTSSTRKHPRKHLENHGSGRFAQFDRLLQNISTVKDAHATLQCKFSVHQHN